MAALAAPVDGVVVTTFFAFVLNLYALLAFFFDS
jgi:hypothetical protein